MTEVFGRPITGSINKSYSQTIKQDPDEVFLEYLDELLDTPGVEAVRWDQYTPYFNDGDPCEFGSNEYSIEVKTSFSDEWLAEEDGDFNVRGTHDFEAYRASGKDYSAWNDYFNYEVEGHDTHKVAETASRFRTRLGGPHENFLKDTFGDHAEVTATKAGFDVEYYDHD